MRRLLAIALVVLFWLPPVFALLPGAQDASLPACCRRGGAHHCAMAGMGAAQATPGHFFSSRHHCPLYGSAARTTVPAFAPAAFTHAQGLSASLIAPRAVALALVESASAPSSRGPPFPLLNRA
ncbi:MAG: hypothetical protein ACLGSD_06200 [Acidobacteriota bacterium]